MEAKLPRIASVLKDVSTHDWKVRVEALRELRSGLAELTLLTCRSVLPQVLQQIGDGRSVVMQEACQTASEICQTFGAEAEFSPIADMLVRACLPIVPSSTRIMAEAARTCLQNIFKATKRGYQGAFDRLVQGATASGKAGCFRLECVRLIDLCLNEWSSEWFVRGDILANVDMVLRKTVRDADPEVRVAARNTFASFAKLYPEEARRCWKEMEPDDKQRFQSFFSGTAPMPQIPSSALLASAKRTPFHASSMKKATTIAPRSALQSSRKPLQMMPTNTPTPTPRVTKAKDAERTVTFAPSTTIRNPPPSAMPSMSARRTDKRAKLVSARDVIKRAIHDCYDADNSEDGIHRKEKAMRDLINVFLQQSEELQLADFTNSVYLIDKCIISLDESLASFAMDAFGTFVLALTSNQNIGVFQSVLFEMLETAFPMALKLSRSKNKILAEASERALDACIERVEHHMLLEVTVAFQRANQDPSVLSLFVDRTRQPEHTAVDMEHDIAEPASLDFTVPAQTDGLENIIQKLSCIDLEKRMLIAEKLKSLGEEYDSGDHTQPGLGNIRQRLIDAATEDNTIQ